jgi:hypothetical protein
MQRPMYVHRNNYARGAYRRFCLPSALAQCRWCGQHKDRLYCYVWEGDDRQVGQTRPAEQWFCNFSCFTDYHN